MFTAVAVLQLIEAGKLSFDTRVTEALDLQGTKIPPQVNIYHLLTMTAGIADWYEEAGDWEANWEALCRAYPIYLLRENLDYLPLFVQKEPLAPPGARFSYSNASYILLGLLIEKAAGKPYSAYIQEQIFEPAGMQASGFYALDDNTTRLAEGYLPRKGPASGWKKNLYAVTPAPAADGGAVSNLADLCCFSQALREGLLLSPFFTQEALTPKVLEDEERYRGYTWMHGYGCSFLLDEAGQIVRWGKTGEEEGVSCRLYYYPQQDLDVVILGNYSGCAGSLAWSIHDLIVNEAGQ
jgi:CubicO group peptidase (beta-lactamase class C family)